MAFGPTLALLSEVDAARSAAAHGGSVPISAVQPAAGVLDTALARSSGQLDLSGPWTGVKGKLGGAIGQAPATGAAAVKAWSGVSSGVVNLVAAIADKSNLTLDPVLDSYYPQDAYTVKIPTLLDSSGLGADLAAVDATRNHDAIGDRQRHHQRHHGGARDRRFDHDPPYADDDPALAGSRRSTAPKRFRPRRGCWPRSMASYARRYRSGPVRRSLTRSSRAPASSRCSAPTPPPAARRPGDVAGDVADGGASPSGSAAPSLDSRTTATIQRLAGESAGVRVTMTA